MFSLILYQANSRQQWKINAIRAGCVLKHVFTCSLSQDKIITFRVSKVILCVLSLDGVVMEGHCFSGTFLGLKIHRMLYFDRVRDEKWINRLGIINIWRFWDRFISVRLQGLWNWGSLQEIFWFIVTFVCTIEWRNVVQSLKYLVWVSCNLYSTGMGMYNLVHGLWKIYYLNIER
jgi:hypothetical protein